MAALPEVIDAGPINLRRCRVDDLDVLMGAIQVSQAELARWLPWADPMPPVEAEEAFLRERVAAFEADQDWGYVLLEPDSGELVGGAGLDRKDDGVTEIGYWVRSDRTRRGYATAAAGALTTAAFTYLPDVDKVIIRTDQANLASAAVAAKLGYQLEGEESLREIATSGHTGKGWIWCQTRAT